LIVLFILGLGLAMGANWRRLALLAFLLRFPIVVMGLAAVAITRGGAPDDDAVGFCQGVGSELRAGSSLRHSIAASALATGHHELARHAWSDSMDTTAGMLVTEFSTLGLELSAATRATARTGASGAELFDELADLAAAQVELDHEVRVASAPARATASLLMVAPIAFLMLRWGDGSLDDLVSRPIQRSIAVSGAALVGLGLLLAGHFLRRAR
jgi:hypothetical protein